MKQLIGMIILVCWGSTTLLSQQYHYYYGGEQNPMTLNTEYAYLHLKGIENPARLSKLIGDAEVTQFGSYNVGQTLNEVPNQPKVDLGNTWAEIRFRKPASERAYLKQLDRLTDLPSITHAAPYFSKGRDEKVGLSELFVVKLQKLGDPELLLTFAAEHNVVVIGQNRFMPEWYTLSVTEATKGNALDMANLFYESGHFVAAEPDLMVEEIQCVNDPLFANQWGLQHTGQWGGPAGLDIAACNGWSNWTTGDNDIVVAVLDHGFEQNHPDLAANNIGVGFDTESGTSPALVLGSHGTACAGIVAARQNNSIGVTGVAPNCRIMSISNSLVGSPNSRQRRADGINWAWDSGADVISNSWGSGVQYTIIDDAIFNALVFGRNGLGTVVVFATGNDNLNSVSYPANTHDDVIAVGAMSPCGERKNPSSCDGENNWGSNYGPELDVIAPGVKIPTTDRQGGAGYSGSDYVQDFNGTSSATPHVAGLAGLILSMNPCLSQHQVVDIIEKTAEKVGSYSYSTTAGRENGTWNNQTGYGMININEAMQMTRELYVQNETLTGNKIYQVQGKIWAGNNVDPSQPSGDVFINSGANIDFIASNEIKLVGGFNVNLGATFDATIISTNCNSWNQNARVIGPIANVIDGPISSTPEVENSMVSDLPIQEVSIVPNPFTSELKLNFSLTNDSKVEASIYNLQGQLVRVVIPASSFAKGYHSQTISLVNGIPRGIYFARLQINEQVITRKLIKQ